MSIRDLKSFINTAERNRELRIKIRRCKTHQNLVLLAKEYGFCISFKDFEDEAIAAKAIGDWFEKSKIAPIKNN